MGTDVTLEIEIVCEKCGNSLEAKYHYVQRHRQTELEIEPCKTCMEEVKSESDSEGYDRGYEEGLAVNDSKSKEISNG